MITMEKRKNGNGYDVITIYTEEGSFNISYQGNLDLYWDINYTGKYRDVPEVKTFIITKENYYLYSSLEQLYKAIKEKKPFGNGIYDDLKEKKYDDKYFPYKLWKDNKIEWHSDDFRYDEASILTISKEKESFKIEFKRSTNKTYIPTHSIRFRNSGSIYDPYNATFMNMYNRLRQYDFDYHQIHMEEYLYNQKKKKTKKRK